MILAELKAYLAAHRRVELNQLAHRFDVAPDALRGMLDRWVEKGRIRRLDPGPGADRCDTCCGCRVSQPEIYEWQDG
jgi:predicted ArsR family transcriptional regulator